MKQYLLSVHYVEGQEPPPADTIAQMHADVSAFNEHLMATGAYIFAGGLNPPETSTVVQWQDGAVVKTDGPFPESRQQLGGFWVVGAVDLDAAIALAEMGSKACQGPVDVRPFQDDTPDHAETP